MWFFQNTSIHSIRTSIQMHILLKFNSWRKSWTKVILSAVTVSLRAAILPTLFCSMSISRLKINDKYDMSRGRLLSNYSWLIFHLILSVRCVNVCAGCFLVLGIIICGAKPSQDDTAVKGASLSWSFTLAIVADVILWIGFFLFYAEYSFTIDVP